jgi:hypothetical protein
MPWMRSVQGCQIFLDTMHQKGEKYTKWPQTIPNGHKLDIPNGHKIFLMVIRYTNIFHSKAFQNLPKIGIFGLKINHLATLDPSHFYRFASSRFNWSLFRTKVFRTKVFRTNVGKNFIRKLPTTTKKIYSKFLGTMKPLIAPLVNLQKYLYT